MTDTPQRRITDYMPGPSPEADRLLKDAVIARARRERARDVFVVVLVVLSVLLMSLVGWRVLLVGEVTQQIVRQQAADDSTEAAAAREAFLDGLIVELTANIGYTNDCMRRAMLNEVVAYLREWGTDLRDGPPPFVECDPPPVMYPPGSPPPEPPG